MYKVVVIRMVVVQGNRVWRCQPFQTQGTTPVTKYTSPIQVKKNRYIHTYHHLS